MEEPPTTNEHFAPPGFAPAWIQVSGHLEREAMNADTVDKFQGYAAELMRLDQADDRRAFDDLIFTSMMPVYLIVVLVEIARRLGERAYGVEEFRRVLTEWKPGDTFEHDHEWRGPGRQPISDANP